METEAMNKSLDEMIDQIFAKSEKTEVEAEVVEKSEAPETIKIAEKKPAKDGAMESKKPPMTADENGAKEEGEEDEEEGKKRGRPEDLSQMSKRDMKTGESKGKYDASITSPAKKVPNETTVAKSIEVSEEDYEILVKAKADRKERELKKAQTEQISLMKSAIEEAIRPLKEENEELKKSLASFSETQALVNKLAKKPQPRKSISSVQVMEKSFGNPGGAIEGGEETFTKSEKLDAAEELVKSGKLTVTQAIELEDTGYIYEREARETLERHLKTRK